MRAAAVRACGASVITAWIASRFLRAPRTLHRLVLVLVLLIPAVAVESQKWQGDAGTMQLTPRQREAFEYLRGSHTFAQPHVGFGGDYSGEYLALRIISRSPHADAAFKELVRSGTAAGRLYGLIGLHHTDPVAFRVAAAELERSNDQVAVLAGCILSREPVREIVSATDAIVVERGETLQDAWEKRPRHRPYVVDVAHGGYPAMFFAPAARGEEDALRAEEAYEFKRH